MKKSQLLSTAGVAILLTFGTAYAQGSKDQHQNAPQAAAHDQSMGQAEHGKSAEQKSPSMQRSTTGQASEPERSSGAQQRDMNRGAQQREMNRNAAQAEQRGKTEQAHQKQAEQKQTQENKAARTHEKNAAGMSHSPKNAAKQPSATEKRSTTGQASPSTSTPSKQAAQPSGTNTQASGAQSGQTRQAQGVHLNPQQQTRVADAVFSSNVPRVNDVDFSVGVGIVVPSSVELVPVPESLVEIYPEWRGDEVVVIRDEIVVVDHSRRIVAVVPSGRHHASVGSSTITVESLPRDEIREIQTVLIERGFLHARADGVWGRETREALITFQRREGLQATGEIDTRTVSSLGLSNKIHVGGAQGQQGGAATMGSAPRGQNNAATTSGRSNTPSSKSMNETNGQGSTPSSRSMNETKGQGSPSAREPNATQKQPSNKDSSMHQPSTKGSGMRGSSAEPKSSSEGLKNSTTGQGSTPSMSSDEHKKENRAK